MNSFTMAGLSITLWFMLLSASFAAPHLPAHVLSIGDGDTIRVILPNHGKVNIRFACVDSPETAQIPWGNNAKARLKEILPAGSAVTLEMHGKDKYDRYIAEVFKSEQSINLQMVGEGHAVIYPQYAKACQDTIYLYNLAQSTAQHEKLGFWNQPSPVMPWDFRRAPLLLPALQSDPSATWPACTQSDCDCNDFQSQEEAQRVFEGFPKDKFKLDGNGNGAACDLLPQGAGVK